MVGISKKFVLAFASFFCIANANATVAVVDMQAISMQAKSVQVLNERVEKRSLAVEQDITVKEEQIRKESEDLNQKKSAMSDEAYNKANEELNQKILSIKNDMNNERNNMSKVYYEALAHVQNALQKIVSDIAKEEGYSVVLNKSAVLYSNVDITDKVIVKLNVQLPDVEINFNNEEFKDSATLEDSKNKESLENTKDGNAQSDVSIVEKKTQDVEIKHDVSNQIEKVTSDKSNKALNSDRAQKKK